MLVCYVWCFQLIGRTWNSPTQYLEHHILWEEAAILVKFLLMLSFNDRLDGNTLSYDCLSVW